MIKNVNKRLFNFIIIFISTFGIDIILRLIRGSNIFNWAVFRMFLSSLLISYIVSWVFTRFKEKITIVLNLLFSLIISVYAVLQLSFFSYVGTYMSFKTSEQAYKVMEFLGEFLASIDLIYLLELIPFGLLIIYYFILMPILKKFFNFEIKLVNDKKRTKFVRRIIKVSVVVFLIFMYYITLISPFMQSKYQIENNLEVFLNPENQSVAVDQLGITMFFITDLNSVIFNLEPPIEKVPLDPVKKPEPEEVTDYTRVIDDTAWLKVIEKEKNSRLKQLHHYFISREITPKNEYTGIFKDKNVIFIMMESVSLLGINEEYFPTLYKLWDEGISFSNFYSPRNQCPTGNNEMTAMVGLYTINNVCTANAYRRNTYPQAVFNLFKNEGYYVSSYHNYVDQFYYRNQIHRNAGSEKYYNSRALKMKNVQIREWPSDVELFEKGLPYFVDQEKFMSFMTTVTGHSRYDVSSVYGDKNIHLFDEPNLSMHVKRYYSKIYETDLGLKYLLEELERKGKLDDTVLVLFGDHQPYALGDKRQIDILGEDAGRNKNLDKTPFIIYNSQIEGQHIDKYVSIIDILPTILNMFDLNYDPRYYVGEDIFNDKVHHRAIFTDGSWQDEIGFYNAATDKFILNDPENIENAYTDEEIILIKKEIRQRQKMSTLAIKNNYFANLDEALQKYK